MDLSNDVNYDSDDSVADVVDLNGTNQPSFPDLDSDIGVEFVGIIKNSSSSVGDAVIQALDTLICPSALPVVFTNNEPAYKKVKRYRSNRPKNWRLIAQYYKENRNAAGTIHHFHLQNDKIARTNQYWITTFGRWVKDLDIVDYNPSMYRNVAYGEKIDLELKSIVLRYFDHAVPMTNMILRLQLIALLQADHRDDILDRLAEPKEALSETKIYRFDASWALRFYKRHKLVARVATTKMREELPAKYEEKIRNYQLILSLNIVDHNVPDALILNMDETNTLFVPQIPRTRCLKGTRRVRLIGIGHDKAQVTTTPTVNAEGDVVKPTQNHFWGENKKMSPKCW
jgi:hypothetical protein